MTNPRKQKRYTFSLSARTEEQLEELRVATDALSSAEVIRKALQVYETVILNQLDGGEGFIQTPDGEMKPIFGAVGVL